MKHSVRNIWVNLAWIGLLTVGQALAAETNSVVADGTDPAAAGQESLIPGPRVGGAEPEIPDGQTEARLLHEEPTEILADSVFGRAESAEAYETVSLDGGTFGGRSVDTCCAVCGGGSCCPPAWYTEHGVRVLTLSKPRNSPLSASFIPGAAGFPNAVHAKMTTTSFSFDIAPGYATTIGRYLGRDTENRDHFVEFYYWGMNRWNRSKMVTGNRLTDSQTFPAAVTFGSLFTLFEPTASVFDTQVGGFNRADEHSITYAAEFNNFELNVRLTPRARGDRLVLHPNGRWRRECQPGTYRSLLFGLRLLSLDESFQFLSRGAIESGGASELVSGEYSVRTHNDVFGLQVGIDHIHRQCKWEWGFHAKVGPFVNFADQFSHVVTDAAADPFAVSDLDYRRYARRNHASLIGEIGLMGRYKIRPNMSLRASYDLLWATGLARAPEQICFQTEPPTKINSNGHIYTHGLTFGAEWTW